MKATHLERIGQRVKDAGFFHSTPEDMNGWVRLSVCSAFRNGRLTGNSFWIAQVEGRWVIGAWGGTLYSLAEADPADVCIKLLSTCDHTQYSFPDDIVAQFAMTVMQDGEFPW